MVNTRSAIHNQPSRLMPSVIARRQRNSPQPIQNPLFHHRYNNLSERLSDIPCPSPTQASHGNPGDPNSSPPDNEGNGGDNNGHNLNPGSINTPVPKPESKPEPEDTGKVLTKPLTQLSEFVDPDRQEVLMYLGETTSRVVRIDLKSS